MIDYPTYCRIHALHKQEGLNAGQIARELGLRAETVSRWLQEPRYRQRQGPIRRGCG